MSCRTFLEYWLFALLLALAPTAGAQPLGVEWGGVRGEVLSARLRYSVEARSGEQRDLGPGLTYSGSTLNDVALGASYFLQGGALGLSLSGERSAFSLREGDTRVTGGALFRGYLLPTLRVSRGPLELHAMAGYGFAQVPAFGESARPELMATPRHSALLGLRVALHVPVFARPARVELEGLLPVVNGVSEAGGASARSSGVAVGAHLAVQLAARGPLAYSAVLSGQFIHDSLTVQLSPQGERHSSQRLLKAGIGLEVALLGAKAPGVPQFGGVDVRVVDADTGAAVPEASGVVVVGGSELALAPGEGGLQASEVAPGEVVVRASAPGYLVGEARATVVAGQSGQVVLSLRPEPQFGTLQLRLLDKVSEQPVTKATVEVGGKRVPLSPEGTAEISNLPVGAVGITISAPGYRKAQEVAAVVGGQATPVVVTLVKVVEKLPAHVSGRVRSRKGGKPLAARLEIASARIRTEAGNNGTFRFDIPAGTYRVVISAPGHISQTKRFTVKEGGEAIFNIDLYPSRRR